MSRWSSKKQAGWGAQMVGKEGVAHRIDTLATALYGKMTLDDVARLDLGHAPPFATV